MIELSDKFDRKHLNVDESNGAKFNKNLNFTWL